MVDALPSPVSRDAPAVSAMMAFMTPSATDKEPALGSQSCAEPSPQQQQKTASTLASLFSTQPRNQATAESPASEKIKESDGKCREPTLSLSSFGAVLDAKKAAALEVPVAAIDSAQEDGEVAAARGEPAASVCGWNDLYMTLRLSYSPLVRFCATHCVVCGLFLYPSLSWQCYALNIRNKKPQSWVLHAVNLLIIWVTRFWWRRQERAHADQPAPRSG